MSEVIANLNAFIAGGFTFQTHTFYIWLAYSISALTLTGLLVWTQIQLYLQKHRARNLKRISDGTGSRK